MPGLTTAITAAPSAAYALTTSGIFAVRNADKTSNGDIGRLPVLVGQSCKFMRNLNQNVSIFDNLAKSDSALLKGAAKVADFTSKNINGFIGASSVLKVLQADKEKKKEVMIAETGGLAGMFIGEGWMKNHLDEVLPKLMSKISSKEIHLDALKNNKWYNILKGLVFVGGSIGCSTIGEKVGEKFAQTSVNPFVASKTKSNEKFA